MAAADQVMDPMAGLAGDGPAPAAPVAPAAAGPDLGELAARAQAGSLRAFEELVELLQGRIINYLFRMVGNLQDAEDLTQQAFVRAYRSLDRFDCRYAFTTWLFTIAKRVALNHLRGRKPFTVPLEEGLNAADGRDPAGEAARGDEAAAIWNLARQLKPKQYEVLWLVYGEGFAVREAAGIMGTGAVHARVLLHRARANLLQKMEGKETSRFGKDSL